MGLRARTLLAIAMALAVPLAAAASDLVEVPRAKSKVFGRKDKKKSGAELLQADPERLADQVVKITVYHPGGSHSGSGIVLCQEGERAWVLTARHVVTGDEAYAAVGAGLLEQDSWSLEEEPESRTEIEIAFRGGSPETVRREFEAFDPYLAEDADLALLSFRVGASERLPVASTGSADDLSLGTGIRVLGYHVKSDTTWVLDTGEVRRLEEYVTYSPAVAPGFSGGPVFDRHGRVVGINKQSNAGDFTDAIRIENALHFARPHLPRRCRP